jgi:hypothetical protein
MDYKLRGRAEGPAERDHGGPPADRGGCAVTTAPELTGQTVVVIGGSAGIGLETARRARAEAAERTVDIVLAAHPPGRPDPGAADDR